MGRKIEDNFVFKKEILEAILKEKLINKREVVDYFEKKLIFEDNDFIKFRRIKEKIEEV